MSDPLLHAISPVERWRHLSESFIHGDTTSLAIASVLLSDQSELDRLAAGTSGEGGASFSTAGIANRFIALADGVEAVL